MHSTLLNIRYKMQSFLESTSWNVFITSVILINSACLGLETIKFIHKHFGEILTFFSSISTASKICFRQLYGAGYLREVFVNIKNTRESVIATTVPRM